MLFSSDLLTPLLRLDLSRLMLNKEVKVILDLVRMKVNAARSKIVSIVITTLISGLLVSIPVPVSAAPLSEPTCVSKVGVGGLAKTNGNNGCVIVKYDLSGTTYFETFNYTGSNCYRIEAWPKGQGNRER